MKMLMKYRSSFHELPSWSLLPLTKDSSIVAGHYDPDRKVLALIGYNIKESLMAMPKLDENGIPMQIVKGGPKHPDNFKHERVRMEKYMEHYLSHPDDIKWFLENFVENNFGFMEENPSKGLSAIITPDQF